MQDIGLVGRARDFKLIVGSMTVYISGSVDTFKPSEVHDAVRDYIQNEQESYADVEDLLHVAYTGARDAEIVKPTTSDRVVGNEGVADPGGRKMSLIGISLATIATLVVLLFVALIAGHRRHNTWTTIFQKCNQHLPTTRVVIHKQSYLHQLAGR
jgi:hypothetical protein